jgi:hypothetical protein
MTKPILEDIPVPEHRTQRLTIPDPNGGPDWVFTSIRSGCIRVQRGDFCSYIPVGRENMDCLLTFVDSHITRTLIQQNRADLPVLVA